jgi:transglutaminase-like putative cysteine protease
MKRATNVLFTLRLFFYFSVIMLIVIHPGVSVSFDRIGIIQWFFIVPLAAVLAFFPSPVIFARNKFIFPLTLLFMLSIFAGGFGPGAVLPFIAGLVSFTLTFLLFHHPRWAKLAALEPFFLAWVCLRLLALSRSGEDIAGQSMALTQFILVWTAAVFLFHSAIVYFCLNQTSCKKAGKEAAVFFLAVLAALVLALVVFPPDFVRNAVINNLLAERIPEKIKSSDSDRGLPMDGGRRRNSRRTVPLGEGGQRPELRGLSEYNWPGRGRGGGAEDNRQYMVMIVASDREPVYMGDSFRGQLDPVEGFLASPQEPLNSLASQRFFVTWFNTERNFDIGREMQEVFSLSTLQNKYLPYRPVSIDPVILNENSGPLRYIHQVVSNTHFGDPLTLVNTAMRSFSNSEKNALAPYLEIPLEQRDREDFAAFLDNALETWRSSRETIILGNRYLREIFSQRPEAQPEGDNEYLETIIALLVNFSKYQYNLSSDDDYSIATLKEFLLNSQEGDCVEFSNSLALLGRLAGIPSRVVTGYLAAEGLQTIAHLRGLAVLRARIPVLQQFPFDNLFMVTNLHSHSWAQFYIPDYGWLDFEATAFAAPPVGMGDFNNWDVVIPLIDEERTFSQVRKFPWQAVLRSVGILAIFALVCAYALRYGREAVLYIGARRGGRAGARSLYLLLLARLAADGQPIKPASKTAHEYADLFRVQTKLGGAEENPHFKTFADIYSQLRWREFGDIAEKDECFLRLRQEYLNILKTTRRRGIHRSIIRLFSLRGLAYL